MGLKEFRVQLDNPNANYEPGQTITGRVILTTKSPRTIKAISCTFKGDADVHWTRIEHYPHRATSILNEEYHYYRSSEEYFKTKIYVLESSSGQSEVLPAGTHSFPFSYTLKSNLPSSFESMYGSIRYCIKATLHQTWKFSQKTKAFFTIICPLDLNKLLYTSEPIILERSKTFWNLSCGTLPLKVKITLPVKGYVHGQHMPIKIDVENKSGVRVNKVKLIFYKVIAYKTRKSTKIVKRTLKTVTTDGIGGQETVNYEIFFGVAPLTPSFLEHCSIIDLDYKLKIKACTLTWLHRNLTQKTSIVIGTIPLKNYRLPSPPQLNSK